jgi:hypothetical protein
MTRAGNRHHPHRSPAGRTPAPTRRGDGRQAQTPPPSRDELENLVRDASELVTILADANTTDEPSTQHSAYGSPTNRPGEE